MSTNKKATMAKRQREMEQKDRVKEREQRRFDRRARAQERADSGVVGPGVGEIMHVEDEASPVAQDENAARLAASGVYAGPAERVRPTRATRLFVGNLAFSATAESLRELFASVGEVIEVYLASDAGTGEHRGFAFVTMASAADGARAIAELGGHLLDDRPLRVDIAEERGPRPGGNRNRRS
jgi:hypothetical protein